MVDHLTLMVVWNKLIYATREMRDIIVRTSQNFLTSELQDVSTSIIDGKGRLTAIVQGLIAQLFVGPPSVLEVMKKYEGNIFDGDIFVSNDPYTGASNHPPDWAFFKPVFWKDKFIFWTFSKAHQMDSGGAYPSGYFADAYDIHAEGLRIPPLKIFDRGVKQESLHEFILANVRFPNEMRLDHEALLASLRIGEKRCLEVVEKYGAETVLECVEKMIQTQEKATKAIIARMRNGTFHGEASCDDDGTTKGKPVWVKCEATISGEEAVVDFSGSDHQVNFVNSPLANTLANVYPVFLSLMDPDLSPYVNSGSYAPIKVIAPAGSVVNCIYPATCGAAPVTLGTQIEEAVIQAVAQAQPDQMYAAWARQFANRTFGIDPRTGKRYVCVLFNANGGGGAVKGYDGWPHLAPMGARGFLRKASVEMLEMYFPWHVNTYEMLQDSEGPGRWRGGPGMKWEWTNEGSDTMTTTGTSDGETTRPQGIVGGMAPSFCKQFIIRKGSVIQMRSKDKYNLEPQDIMVLEGQGGAGYGNPAERDPEMVRQDVVNGLVSIQRARDVYRVEINQSDSKIDLAGTRVLREKK